MFANSNFLPNAQILFVDFDENIAEVQLKDQPFHSHLSDSAAQKLSESATGVSTDLVMWHSERGTLEAESAIAFARQEIVKTLFKPYFDILTKANANGIQLPIEVVILTAASYQEDKVRPILDQFYGDIPSYSNEFNEGGKFAIKVFHKFDYLGLNPSVADEAQLREPKALRLAPNSFEEGAREKLTVVKDAKGYSIYDPKKAIKMKMVHEELAQRQILIPKSHMTLMDNCLYNLDPVEDAGFSGIHNSTTPALNPPGSPSFTESFPVTLAKLAAVFKKANDLLDAAIAAKHSQRAKPQPTSAVAPASRANDSKSSAPASASTSVSVRTPAPGPAAASRANDSKASAPATANTNVVGESSTASNGASQQPATAQQAHAASGVTTLGTFKPKTVSTKPAAAINNGTGPKPKVL